MCGLTPAYAGKTSHFMTRRASFGAHPRVCGEDGRGQLSERPVEGSPPRMRGRLLFEPGDTLGVRLTPAYAGKTARGVDVGA